MKLVGFYRGIPIYTDPNVPKNEMYCIPDGDDFTKELIMIGDNKLERVKRDKIKLK